MRQSLHIETHTSKLRTNLSACLDHNHSTGDRILLPRNGRPAAALASPKNLHALEKVEGSREELLEKTSGGTDAAIQDAEGGIIVTPLFFWPKVSRGFGGWPPI